LPLWALEKIRRTHRIGDNWPTIRIFALLLVCFCFFSLATSADDYFFVIQKQEQKKSGRRNLEDWLDKRDRMRMMYLWLSMHSTTPYDFYLGALLDFIFVRIYGGCFDTSESGTIALSRKGIYLGT